ncbi:hypothetical protein K4039_14725 [Lyngbya sp. CCAP 1446/10]|nr:hypothetical protein [Lyngbya sp. CCAP 1446/10]MCW6051311.1 hypothetical protein [Lyngbya sp. CCAP 1446/10]
MTAVKQRWIDASAIATNTSILAETQTQPQPNPPAMPKLSECVGFILI